MARKPVRRVRPPKTPLLQRLRGDFLTGLVVVLPAFLTFYVVYFLVDIVDARVIPLIPRQYNPQNIFGRNIFGLGLVIFVVFTTIVGALTKGYLGARMIYHGEQIVERMPVVRSIYNALKQIAETVFSPSSTSFQQACLVEYPRRGMWAIAFVATEARGEIPEKTGEAEMLNVFVPTTPNLTHGFVRFVPKRDVVMLEMSVEDAARIVISGGMVNPADPRAAPPTRPRRAPARAPASRPATPTRQPETS